MPGGSEDLAHVGRDSAYAAGGKKEKGHPSEKVEYKDAFLRL